MNITIKPYQTGYSKEITDLFYLSIHKISPKYYSKKELDAWAKKPIDYQMWQERLMQKKPFLAFSEEKVVGFIELEDDGHIDCFYVHPNFQKIGVGDALFKFLLERAREMKIERLYVEASKVARDFFEKREFTVVRGNIIKRDGVELVNYTMEKYLLTRD